ncbi:hypothetical protein SAMN05216551_11924 [Chitinasiproducens palmae]|uniref:Uncharacterized protein n=1 Tax=Chitinasiproducens palmae TaxID=1770053 RepID=A0A1H2PW93_9BURK|nr:hypothetical protein SAMN05216551_11924 [Chitinasiproducens palmae]
MACRDQASVCSECGRSSPTPRRLHSEVDLSICSLSTVPSWACPSASQSSVRPPRWTVAGPRTRMRRRPATRRPGTARLAKVRGHQDTFARRHQQANLHRDRGQRSTIPSVAELADTGFPAESDTAGRRWPGGGCASDRCVAGFFNIAEHRPLGTLSDQRSRALPGEAASTAAQRPTRPPAQPATLRQTKHVGRLATRRKLLAAVRSCRGWHRNQTSPHRSCPSAPVIFAETKSPTL